MTDYGQITHDGIVLTLTQQPYPTGTYDAPVYRAQAVDADGHEYRVLWPMTRPDADDGMDAADWDIYMVIPE